MTIGPFEKVYFSMLVLAMLASALFVDLMLSILILALGLFLYAVLVGTKYTWRTAKSGDETEKAELKNEWSTAPLGLLIAIGIFAVLLAIFAGIDFLLT